MGVELHCLRGVQSAKQCSLCGIYLASNTAQPNSDSMCLQAISIVREIYHLQISPILVILCSVWAGSSVVEHRTFNPLVEGSNPSRLTMFLV